MTNRYDMRIKTKYKKYFRAVCFALFSLAFTGCTKDDLNEFGPGNATGKVVMVSLNVSLPPIEEPTPTGRYATVKPFLIMETTPIHPSQSYWSQSKTTCGYYQSIRWHNKVAQSLAFPVQ